MLVQSNTQVDHVTMIKSELHNIELIYSFIAGHAVLPTTSQIMKNYIIISTTSQHIYIITILHTSYVDLCAIPFR